MNVDGKIPTSIETGVVHSPHEIISTAGKTGHNSRQKRNQSWNLLIHISNKSASIKTKSVLMKSSTLLCLNLILVFQNLANQKHSQPSFREYSSSS